MHNSSFVQSILVELVDNFFTEKLRNDLFIYLWKCIVLAGK